MTKQYRYYITLNNQIKEGFNNLSLAEQRLESLLRHDKQSGGINTPDSYKIVAVGDLNKVSEDINNVPITEDKTFSNFLEKSKLTERQKQARFKEFDQLLKQACKIQKGEN